LTGWLAVAILGRLRHVLTGPQGPAEEGANGYVSRRRAEETIEVLR
jgi:hypothetical protein